MVLLSKKDNGWDRGRGTRVTTKRYRADHMITIADPPLHLHPWNLIVESLLFFVYHKTINNLHLLLSLTHNFNYKTLHTTSKSSRTHTSHISTILSLTSRTPPTSHIFTQLTSPTQTTKCTPIFPIHLQTSTTLQSLDSHGSHALPLRTRKISHNPQHRPPKRRRRSSLLLPPPRPYPYREPRSTPRPRRDMSPTPRRNWRNLAKIHKARHPQMGKTTSRTQEPQILGKGV